VSKTIPARDQVDTKYTWNSESVFASNKDWEIEVQKILSDIENVTAFKGHLKESPSILLKALKASDELMRRVAVAYMYAGFSFAVDTTYQKSAGMRSQGQSMYGKVRAALSFIQPEILEIGKPKFDKWMQQESELAVYAHYFDDLFRKQAHIRSTEVEELLGMVSDPLSGPGGTASMMTNADFKFQPAIDSDGKELEISQSMLIQLMGLPDRTARKSAWELYMDRYVEFKNTLASNLITSIKANVFYTRAREHDSTLAGSLFDLNIPVEVFHNLIDTFKKNLPVWHRYFDIRRRTLGLEKIAYYDMWAPLTGNKVKVPYEKAVEMICAGLAPMGKEYVEIIRRGCLEERWVDVYPNKGKGNGAFSWGAPGTHPFIMMSYNDEMINLSTLAHELGHSMHSYLTWKHQPLVYTDYSLFVAEVASNFHQAMVRAHLLNTSTDKDLQIAIILEAMSNFFRYFFQMPTLARFELETHERVERGEPLTADSMLDLMADLFAEGFGPNFDVDRPRVGMVWSTFGHLFSDYYVYSYATGIAGAHALSSRILHGEPNAVEDYLGFLKAGASDYSLNVLKKAGVDLTTPKPVEETFTVMEGYIDRLEKLLNE
jgi:oligoendopeptidase F